jgi:hypothetical protein
MGRQQQLVSPAGVLGEQPRHPQAHGLAEEGQVHLQVEHQGQALVAPELEPVRVEPKTQQPSQFGLALEQINGTVNEHRGTRPTWTCIVKACAAPGSGADEQQAAASGRPWGSGA